METQIPAAGRAVQYLRARHRYCHYCRSRFATAAALEDYCRADDACADLFALDCARLPPAPRPLPRAAHAAPPGGAGWLD